MKRENNPVVSQQEKYFLNTFPLIRRLTWKKLSSFYREAVEDISQTVILKLWKWKENQTEEKKLTEEEWLKLANTTTQNEVKRFYSTQLESETSISQLSIDGMEDEFFTDKSPTNHPTGNTKTELHSLLLVIWRVINTLTPREKYALLLKRRYLINELTSHHCCNTKEIADVLELPVNEYLAIFVTLPLKDHEIGLLLENKLATKITAKQIIEARNRARVKIRDSLTSNNQHGRTSVTEKNRDVFS